MATKAEAKRWLEANEGRTIDTAQVTASNGYVWAPGPRTLARKGKTRWVLDGSEVRITSEHKVAAVTDNALTLEWRDEAGTLINTTTYTREGA